FVSDLQAERDFYVRLGFHVTCEGPEYPYFLAHGHGALEFGIEWREGFSTSRPDQVLTWQFGITDLELAKKRLAEAGVRFREGLIEARAGSGSYVRKAATARNLEHDRPAEPGSPFGVDGGEYAEPQTQLVVPPARIARRLGLPPDGRAIATQYLLTCAGDPV